ncbi:response regulator [Paenibacillus lycopersici]|uniref:Circadian input-output histidine kinase CikA n=1 Tax=Paenibacillus lycopersici TaxID=2704462 RepID=A0A6C0FZV1_9BACL|nr:response regulator [Paenibacillus lycopersici]QHT61053.1 response regulator [Paenibacillus lycopersici]
MKLRTKLIVGFASILMLLVLFAIIVLNMFFSMNQAMHGIVNDNYARVKLANNVRANINGIYSEMSALLLNTEETPHAGASRDKIDQAEVELNTNLNELSQMFEDKPDARKLVQTVQILHTSFINSANTVLQFLQDDNKSSARQWYNQHTEPLRSTLFSNLNQFNSLQEQEMDQALKKSSDRYMLTIRAVSLLVVATFLGGAFVAVWVFRSVVRSLSRIIAVMNQASFAEHNDRLPRIELKTEDEIASIGHAYNVMAGSLERHAQEQGETNRQLQEQNWNKSKVAEITALYQGIQTLTGLADVFITFVTPAIGASYGVFYLRQDTEEGAPRLAKAGVYASAPEAVGAEGFSFGEGLVGQCAVENRMLLLTEPPTNYIRIGSGLGYATPHQIAIVPVSFEGSVVAVIEFASFHAFNPDQLQLLDDLTEVLGITIHSVSGHMQVQQLLSESQLFSEELQTQSEELQLQQEELKALNDQLREQIEASERKSAELEKIKVELEDKNEHVMLASSYKTEFLTNMSHELRTPLNSLLILSQMLADNKEGNLTPKQVEYSQTIYSSGRDLLGLINEVLDLSKIEAGKLEVTFDWVRLNGFAEFVTRQFEPVAADKGLCFEVKLGEAIADLMIYTDEQRLQQVLQNLLSNAFKFTEQGTVAIEMQLLPVEHMREIPFNFKGDIVLSIAVSDTGIGIPADKQGVIFEAFRQADGTTSRKFGGTGLGLSICQKIAQLLDGYIRVDSEEGAGSKFTLYLPVNRVRGELLPPYQEAAAALDMEAADSAADAQALVDSTLEGKKVLLVDDDLRNIYALMTALETQRIDVIFAENGQEGIHLLQENSDVDLVLMDIMMPKMDGYEAIREIRKNARYTNLPIIALTAKAMKYDREKCIEAGANDYISKPIQLNQLLSLIRVWLYR